MSLRHGSWGADYFSHRHRSDWNMLVLQPPQHEQSHACIGGAMSLQPDEVHGPAHTSSEDTHVYAQGKDAASPLSRSRLLGRGCDEAENSEEKDLSLKELGGIQ